MHSSFTRTLLGIPSVATFSVLGIANTNFELRITNFKYTASGLTLTLLRKSFHVSVIITDATFQENKGFTCGSIYVGISQCSSIALKMDEITMAGGVALTIMILYPKLESCCFCLEYYVYLVRKKHNTVHITRELFKEFQKANPCRIHITTANDFTTVFIKMTDIKISDNMGVGLSSPTAICSVYNRKSKWSC